jgi:hypothetical protein
MTQWPPTRSYKYHVKDVLFSLRRRVHGTNNELESGKAATAQSSYLRICLKGLGKTVRKSHLGQGVARKSERGYRTTQA